MANQNTPRYGLEARDDDSWELARTKQVLRAIVATKNDRGLTTARLAELCSEFSGEDIKPATLNGLFAGKRKSLSITELVMFAAVLKLPVLDLLFPPREDVRFSARGSMQSASALAASMHWFSRDPLGEDRASTILLMGLSVELVAEHAQAAIAAHRQHGTTGEAVIALEKLRSSLRSLRGIMDRFAHNDWGDAPHIRSDVNWVRAVDPDHLNWEALAGIEQAMTGRSVTDE